MIRLFQTVTDLNAGADILRSRRYGVIQMSAGKLTAIRFRPWPKIPSLMETWLDNRRFHKRTLGDRCWLYFNQPCGHSRFLALVYVVSSCETKLATFHGSLAVLDEIARIKQSDAIVCEVSNVRISDRLLKRWGWQSHCPNLRGRHFIKRFYGTYPQFDAKSYIR